MKKLKRIVGVIVAAITLAMCLSISVFASSESVTPKGTITIKNDKSDTNVSIAGKEYTAYKVFNLVQNDDHSAYAYTLNSAFEGLFESKAFSEAFPNANVDETKTSTIYSFVSGLTDAKDIESFANVIYSFATNEESPVTATKTATASTTSETNIETAVFDELELGYYLINGSGVSMDNTSNVVTACALDTTTWTADPTDSTKGEYAVTIDVKVGVPTVEKKIVQNKGETSENLVDVDSANIGDTINFRVTSNVPDLTGYTAYTFTMTDTMSKGLTFNNDLVIKIGSTVIENSTDDETEKLYTVTSNNDKDTGVTTITVTFTDFYTLITEGQYAQGTVITYDYSAILNENAAISPNANPNTVKLTYSNDPHNTTTNDTADDTVNVYTFKLDIYKYTDHGAANTPLAGAEFEVRKGNTLISFVEDNGKYRVATAGDTSTTTTVVSGNDGYIHIEGLGEGDYTLKETEAPKGYNLLESDISVKIEPEYENGSLKELTAPAENAAYTLLDDNAGIKTDVENTTGTELPSTGGMGTVLIYIVGGLLIAIAVISVTARKIAKKKA